MPELLVEQNNHICTLTLNRPQKRNSLTPQILEQLVETFDRLGREGETRVAIIRGAGEEAFSSGFDIGQIDENTGSKQGNHVSGPAGAIVNAPFPVIAMVHGFCMGLGLEIATSCDLRFASESARFAMPPAKLGLVYQPDGFLRFVNLIGVAHTKEMFFRGRLIPSSRALEIGLVSYVLPAEELSKFTYDVAEEIAQNAPLSVSGTKEVINRALRFQQLSEQDRASVEELIRRAVHSEDVKEGQKAFFEKRKPVFKGR